MSRALLILLVGCAPVRPALVQRPVRAVVAHRATTHVAVEASTAYAEPGVADVVRMALDAAGGLAPERTLELARRARLTGLVPQLRVSVERGLKQNLTSSTTSMVDKTALGDDFSLSAALTFELDKLMFASDEVRLLSVERWLAGDQRKLLNEVVKLYYQRRRLLRDRAATQAPDRELDDALAEVEALLDGVTGGAFTRALR